MRGKPGRKSLNLSRRHVFQSIREGHRQLFFSPFESSVLNTPLNEVRKLKIKLKGLFKLPESVLEIVGLKEPKQNKISV